MPSGMTGMLRLVLGYNAAPYHDIRQTRKQCGTAAAVTSNASGPLLTNLTKCRGSACALRRAPFARSVC